ncbi:hypothetical protein C0Q70_02625 [Pomacea canaliculata]|uniref:Uncharacterized protein n=1 Tax=Pomacea canaliculata TaxID=400727 RepID=A0A2T7PQF5_POMCA|nr:hypothetical protein C0Q70_02625 [Pomacea canaliculata]
MADRAVDGVHWRVVRRLRVDKVQHLIIKPAYSNLQQVAALGTLLSHKSSMWQQSFMELRVHEPPFGVITVSQNQRRLYVRRLRLAPSCHPPFRPLARESRAQGTCARRQPFAREVQPSSDTRSMFSITWRSPGKVMGNQNSFDIGPCNAAQGIPVKGQPASFSVPAGSDLSPLAGYTPATPCHLATNH